MTPDGLKLDPEIVLSKQPLILFRIARRRYANLSGVGAAAYPGRWNRIGQEAIYTSTEIGIPILERLVHTPKNVIPSNLALMKIRITGSWEAQKNAARDISSGDRSRKGVRSSWEEGVNAIDQSTGGCISLYRSLIEARASFASGADTVWGGMNPFAVAVPSVVAPAWNLILYPQGVGFWDHVSLQSIDEFEFDPRLFPDDAVFEPK